MQLSRVSGTSGKLWMRVASTDLEIRTNKQKHAQPVSLSVSFGARTASQSVRFIRNTNSQSVHFIQQANSQLASLFYSTHEQPVGQSVRFI